jgi:hypothetical protein
MAAAKAALKRKKAHEHSLDQTVSQIGTLEQQINAIESANINRETLAAMERAGDAMKAIHGKLTPEKVDETMYAETLEPPDICDEASTANMWTTGTNCASRTLSVKKSSTRSRATKSAMSSTNKIWKTNLRQCNKSNWMSRCSTLAQCLWQTDYLRWHRDQVRAAFFKSPKCGGFPKVTDSIITVKGKQVEVEEDDEEVELRKLQAEMAM